MMVRWNMIKAGKAMFAIIFIAALFAYFNHRFNFFNY